MMLQVSRLYFVVGLLSLVVGFEGYASEGEKSNSGELKVYNSLTQMPYKDLPFLPYDKEPFKTKRPEKADVPRLLKHQTFACKQRAFIMHDIYYNTGHQAVTPSGNKDIFQQIQYTFEAFIVGSICPTRRVASDNRKALQDIIAAVEQFQPTKKEFLEIAYEEIKYHEKEVLPRMARAKNNLALQGREGVRWLNLAQYLGKYKILLELEMENSDTAEAVDKTEGQEVLKLEDPEDSAELEQLLKGDSFVTMTGVLSVASIVVGIIGILWFLKKQFSYS